MMEVSAEDANNGYIVRIGDETIVYQEGDDETEYSSFADFLYTLNHLIGPPDGRYNDERIYISIYPGDKNMRFGTEDCPICGCNYEAEHARHN